MLLLRICFFVCAFTLIVITVLANMGGSGETWHEGVRSFISEFAGGRPVKLGKLNHMGFFPIVLVDIDDVEILAKPDDTVPLIEVEKFRIGMPFLDVATRSPRITEFYVEGLSAIKGVFMPKEFSLKKLFIDHDQESAQAALRVNGKIGLQSWSLDVGLEVQKGITGKNSYVLASKSPFSFDFADINIKGIYNHASPSHLKIEGFELRAGEKVINGDIIISLLSSELLKLKGTLNIQHGRTIISPDLVIDLSHKDGAPAQVSGDITSEKLVLDDILGEESVFGVLTRLRELMGYQGVVHRVDGAPAFLGTYDMNLHAFLNNVEAQGAFYEALSFDVFQEAGRLRIGSVIGKDERKLMPPFMLMQDPKSERIISIIQDGSLDIGLLRPWLKHLPSAFLAKQATNVNCGIGVFFEDKDMGTLNIEAFALDTSDGRIAATEKRLDEGQSPLNMHFELSDDVALKNIALSKGYYDFVQSSLQEAGKGSSCTPYISLQELKQE